MKTWEIENKEKDKIRQVFNAERRMPKWAQLGGYFPEIPWSWSSQWPVRQVIYFELSMCSEASRRNTPYGGVIAIPGLLYFSLWVSEGWPCFGIVRAA
jgi:hypothetical protein